MSEALPESCDLLVIGSGAGGLSAAVTAAALGLDVLVVEKEKQFGGTTAWSGGWMWIPRNPLARAAGIEEDEETVRTYLRHELGEGYDESFVTMLLEQGPRMVSFFRRDTAVDFVDGNLIPDFHGRTPGAGLGGRSLCAKPFDGGELGARLADLRPPLEEVAPFGMNIASGIDLRHFLNATRRWPSFLHVLWRLARHFTERALHGRGLHLVNGNALAARLLKSADDLGVTLRKSTAAVELMREGERVTGAVLDDGTRRSVRATRGVVLATGGFPHDDARKAALFPHAPSGREHHSAAPAANTGDGIRLGEAAGGHLPPLIDAGAWSPVSLVPKAGGETGHFPHLVERAKPGAVMVGRDGRRFCNEADSYHDVMRALFATAKPGETPHAWLVCDHAFLCRYGLGRVRPRPFPLGPWLRNGYLKRGRSFAELAQACGVDQGGFRETMAFYNRHAERGDDPAFGRGDTPYNRIQGDAEQFPNPCVAPLVQAPFYAVEIVPGSLGTFAGLKTDAHARVLGRDEEPISGLYAVGNDMSSMMAGCYPAGGITLGPAMTFGYVAAHHASGVPLDNNRS